MATASAMQRGVSSSALCLVALNQLLKAGNTCITALTLKGAWMREVGGREIFWHMVIACMHVSDLSGDLSLPKDKVSRQVSVPPVRLFIMLVQPLHHCRQP